MSRRYHYVDLLRGFAALVVLTVHYGEDFYSRFPGDRMPKDRVPGVYWITRPLWPLEGAAVPLFWALSGFVFAIAYGRYGKGLSIPDFWFRRFARLYPLHFVTLLIMAGLQAYSLAHFGHWQIEGDNDLPHFILQLFLASNWFSTVHTFNAPIWSVSVEELVYFLFLIYLKKLGLSLRGALGLGMAGFAIERVTHNNIALCTAMFFGGVAIAILRPRFRNWLLPAGMAGLGLTGALWWVITEMGYGDHAIALLVYIGAPALLVVAIGLDEQVPPLPKAFRWIGLSTYSIYLLHFPILVALKMTVGVIPFPLFVAIVLAAGYCSYRWFECPVQQSLRQWWSDRRERSADLATR